jgi:hypothetical protein
MDSKLPHHKNAQRNSSGIKQQAEEENFEYLTF